MDYLIQRLSVIRETRNFYPKNFYPRQLISKPLFESQKPGRLHMQFTFHAFFFLIPIDMENQEKFKNSIKFRTRTVSLHLNQFDYFIIQVIFFVFLFNNVLTWQVGFLFPQATFNSYDIMPMSHMRLNDWPKVTLLIISSAEI